MHKVNLDICQRGLHRGNKLYEGHRMILPEHQEKVVTDRKREYRQAAKEVFFQEEEEKEWQVRRAIEHECMVEICWQEILNPLKLSSEEYAAYLHQSLNPTATRQTEVRTEVGRIAGVFAAEGMIKCKLSTGNHLVAIENLLSVKPV